MVKFGVFAIRRVDLLFEISISANSDNFYFSRFCSKWQKLKIILRKSYESWGLQIFFWELWGTIGTYAEMYILVAQTFWNSAHPSAQSQFLWVAIFPKGRGNSNYSYAHIRNWVIGFPGYKNDLTKFATNLGLLFILNKRKAESRV